MDISQSYTPLNAITLANSSVVTRYRKEMSLDVVGFTERQGVDSRQSALIHLFLCLSFVQTVVKRQSRRPCNGKCCDFFVATIKYSPVSAISYTTVRFIWAAR